MPAAEERLEQALRHAVQVVYKIGDLEELTVKRMRKAAEESLHLYEGFFKESEEWKDRSKRIIEEEAVCPCSLCKSRVCKRLCQD